MPQAAHHSLALAFPDNRVKPLFKPLAYTDKLQGRVNRCVVLKSELIKPPL